MSKKPKSRNPFYPLLVIAGTVFAITATAYGVMTLHALRASAAAVASSETLHPLVLWLQQKGDLLMLGEIGVLGLLTFAAIGTDGYWDRSVQGSDDSAAS